MMSRSLKPASSAMRPRRPPLGSRTSSTSSINSAKSQGFPSPRSPSVPGGLDYFSTTSTTDIGRPTLGPTSVPQQQQPTVHDSPRLRPTKPISITLPPRLRSGIGTRDTPPEPLSARGDLLGGYFPLHEDSPRYYKPHPFHARDASSHLRSSSPASTKSDSSLSTTMHESDSPLYSPQIRTLTQAVPATGENQRPPTMTAIPPAASAFPSSLSVPMGKYHPSNYKDKSPDTSAQNLSISQPGRLGAQQHKREKSETEKRLKAYQRDMVQQAALAGRMNLPFTKPTTPNLAPLGSPGPVTPMELEERSEYLMAGLRMSGADQKGIMAEIIKAEGDRAQRGHSGRTPEA